MTRIQSKKIVTAHALIMILIPLYLFSCTGRMREKTANKGVEKEASNDTIIQKPLFAQIHTNLNGMVREFVRAMYQDKRGNYWFGTNGDGIIRYDGQSLEKMTIEGSHPWLSVREIVEDKTGTLWFGTSDGLIKYWDGKFRVYREKEGLPDDEIWGLTLDKNGLLWIGTLKGLVQFDGKKFRSFSLPESRVENPQPMLSAKLAMKILEDKNGMIWLATDGNGIFTFNGSEFNHLTRNNGLTDNNVADIMEDRQGNIWIGTFYGGVSKLDGKTYTNFSRDGIIEGIETYNFCEDKTGNIWFSAEGHGVYKYDGTKFSQYTILDGLASNGVQSILADNKGQLWFGTWQGISLYDGQKFMNANEKEPWTK